MKIEITKYEMNVSDADAICKIVNDAFETKGWGIEICNNMPEFHSNDSEDYWSIEFDCNSLEWKLSYGWKFVGVVEFEDDNDIIWNWKY